MVWRSGQVKQRGLAARLAGGLERDIDLPPEVRTSLVLHVRIELGGKVLWEDVVGVEVGLQEARLRAWVQGAARAWPSPCARARLMRRASRATRPPGPHHLPDHLTTSPPRSSEYCTAVTMILKIPHSPLATILSDPAGAPTCL